VVNEDSEPVAPANAGRSSRGALDVIGPAWLRALFRFLSEFLGLSGFVGT